VFYGLRVCVLWVESVFYGFRLCGLWNESMCFID
jgi:hypothetical protein